MKIEVTAEDIRRGKKISIRTCPIALAAKRIFPDKSVHACLGRIDIGKKRFLIPKFVADWMTRFDKGEKVEPIEFELNYD